MAQPGAAACALAAAAANDAPTLLCRVDDACLLNIFRFLTPLPDLFAAAAVCRVRRVAAAARRLVGASVRATLTSVRSRVLFARAAALAPRHA
jgi:hypothetical protein